MRTNEREQALDRVVSDLRESAVKLNTLARLNYSKPLIRGKVASCKRELEYALDAVKRLEE
jgi:hypothetical protein